MIKKYILLLAAIMWSISAVFSQQLSPEELLKGRWLSQEEYDKRDDVGKFFQPTEAPEGPVVPVAEFEPMQGVIIAYPLGIPMNLVVELSDAIMVTTIVMSTAQANSVATQFENAGANMDNVEFLIEPHDSYWSRDYSPWFIREEDQVSIVDFTYNRPQRPNDNLIPSKIANELGISFYAMPLVLTGGNYMCDGFGVAAQTELIYEENSISDDQVDQIMEDYLGITDNYVITDPLDDYIMHIDCWAKFLDYDKVLVAEVPASDNRYEDFEAAANYFATRNCAYGYPWEVIRVYAPGNSPNTPYTNSLILNDKVFLPITGSPHDEAAIETYEEAMPGYEIIPVMDGDGVNWLNSDALHCRTHEIADVGMLKITHIPSYYGEVEFTGEPFYIEAKIHAYSNEALYTDSLLLNYKINDGEYTEVVMADYGDENFIAPITASFGDEVSYYIHAADESGRSENLPYIGMADPFTFSVSDGMFLTLSHDTLYLEETTDPSLTISNVSAGSIDILDIKEQADHNETWWIDYTVPEITEFPYTLDPGQSIEVHIERMMFKSIFYDSLLVVTEEATYHSIINGIDYVSNNDLDTQNTEIQLLPNPMNGIGDVKFMLHTAAAVELSIYNIQGQLIQNLESSRLNSGIHEYHWNGESQTGQEAENGVYFIYLKMDNEVVTKKWVKL